MNKLGFLTGRWSLKENGDEPGEPKEKRKEQVRRAQKNYRRRKENYVKDLEAEVVHLRTRNSDVRGENEELRGEIRWLRTIIQDNQIALPPIHAAFVSSTSDNSNLPLSATIHCGHDRLNHRRLIVEESPSSLATDPTTSEFEDTAHPAPGQTPDSNPGIRLTQGQTGLTHDTESDKGISTYGWSRVAVGMNFILSLEGPCLDHVRGALQTPDTPNGHALTVTASIFRLAGNPQRKAGLDLPLGVPQQTLERLLALSSQMTTNDELTPTQAWACVCNDPRTSSAKEEQIMAIAETLLHHVKCHGFGGVLPRDVVIRAITEAL